MSVLSRNESRPWEPSSSAGPFLGRFAPSIGERLSSLQAEFYKRTLKRLLICYLLCQTMPQITPCPHFFYTIIFSSATFFL